MINVNQKVRIKPFAHMLKTGANEAELEWEVEGTVKYVNAPHRWFSVEYGEYGQRIAYNFCDIGKSVIMIEE